VGQIQRIFTFTDNNNALLLSSSCTQVIQVISEHDYTIVFPGDQESDQCIEPDYNGVTYTEIGCDLITVATEIDTFSASADECYKLRITYEVLNWCEYNTTDPAYLIPRDADNDGILDMDTTVLHVIPRGFGTEDDLAYLDRDTDRTNFNTIGNLDTGDSGILPGSNVGGYGVDGSRGAFIYEQYIKVYDDTPPVLLVNEPDSAFCSFSVDCTGDVELTYVIQEECAITATLINQQTVELDAFINPGTDGIYTLADFIPDGGDVTQAVTLTDTLGGNFQVNLNDLPIGRHAIRINVNDGCGNSAIDLIVFEVVDCKAPTPICINGLTATLMPLGSPGGGTTGGGMAAIWANDFIASSSSDCSGPVQFALYLDGEQPAIPSAADTGLVLNCDHLGPQTIRVYAIDAADNFDYCLTTLMVQAFAPSVCSGGDGATLSGSTYTALNEPVNDVAVNISSAAGMNASVFTVGGNYQFDELVVGDDYTLEPSYNATVDLSRVTTGDLITISRHILGIQEFSNDYQPLAADVNQDEVINVVDMIGIRRVILGLDNGFPLTDSWRFYLENTDDEETYTENNLIGNVIVPTFIAVEMGNVNGTPLGFNGENEGRSQLKLRFDELEMKAGESYVVSCVGNEKLLGFQGTLVAKPGLEIKEIRFGLLQAGNFNLEKLGQGLLPFSYEGETGELFELEIRAISDAKLSDLLSISDRVTTAEGYKVNGEVTDLSLDFKRPEIASAAVQLFQNVPNPFGAATEIRFVLPQEMAATLIIQNQRGQLLRRYEVDGKTGLNAVKVTREEIGHTAGVLTYTLTTAGFTATRKMILY
jgi:hypothetical protein